LKRSGIRLVFIDTPPAISEAISQVIAHADLVIVPTIPDFLSTYGLNAFCKNLWSAEFAMDDGINAPRRLPNVLITRQRSTVKEHKETAEKIRNESSFEKPSFKPLNAMVPEAAAVAIGDLSAVAGILQAARTDEAGDGIVSIGDVVDVIRIRTGESGPEVL